MPPARRIPLPCGGWLNVHEQAGQGPTLVLIHGLTDCAESFRLMLPDLAGRHLVIPDLRGHGASFRGTISDLASLAGDIEAVLSLLRLDEAIFVGHSMGSLVALHLVLRGRVSAAGLVTISGSLRPGGPSLCAMSAEVRNLPDPLPIDHPFLDAWHACRRPVPEAFLVPLRISCVAMRREDWMACLDLLESTDLRTAARDLQLPSLVLAGSCDEIFARPHTDELVAALNPLRSHVFDLVGHNPHWEMPDQVASELRAFADSCPRVRSATGVAAPQPK